MAHHVIVELRDEFLLRDQPIEKRQDLDGASKKSFWIRAAELFCNKTFNRPA